jgi:hypothetical protein
MRVTVGHLDTDGSTLPTASRYRNWQSLPNIRERLPDSRAADLRASRIRQALAQF